MANTGKTVEVLCPNGRRQKVQVQPSMTVLQILQTVCQKQGFTESDYDLKHIQKVLPVTSMLRYLNLSNNAKLEMVKCFKERKKAVTKVTVALQLEDGSRLQDEFESTVTLKDMLMQFQVKNEATVFVTPGTVCVYMRNEYKGISVLTSTSLQSMGITTGRAAIRLLFREPCEEEDTTVSPVNEVKKHGPNTEGPNLKKQKLDTVIPSITATGSPSTTTGSPSITSPSVVYSTPLRQVFPDDALTRPTEMLPDVSLHPEKCHDLPYKETVNEFTNFKFPESKPSSSEESMDDDLAINPKLIKLEVKLSIPCERQPIAYRIKPDERVLNSEEIDDSFFKVTVDDLRNRMHDLKSRMNTEESVLMTQASRHRKELEKVANFDKIPIRFQFPDKTVLQAFFRPLETVSSLKEFLRDYISNGIRKFELFTAPPKVVLKDENQTLYKAALFPAALVYVSTNEKYALYLKKEFDENLKSMEDAELVLQTQVERAAPNTSKLEAVTVTASSSMASAFRPSTSSSQTGKRSEKVPKWFKTGR